MIEVYELNEENYDEIMDKINKSANAIYEGRKLEVLSGLENDVQRIIFLDWWNHGGLWKYNKETGKTNRAERYRYIDENDWEVASGWIMETVSMGMG